MRAVARSLVTVRVKAIELRPQNAHLGALEQSRILFEAGAKSSTRMKGPILGT